MIKLPSHIGFRGNRAFVEAKASEFGAVSELVRIELAKHLSVNNERVWLNITGLFADAVVVSKEGRFYSYPYSIDENNQVTFSAPTEVVREFAPAAVTKLTEAWHNESRFIESSNVKPNQFLVTLIEVGKSLNGVDYPAAVLREAAPLFENAKCMVKSDDDHLKGSAQHFSNLLGKFSQVKFVEGAGAKKRGALQATLSVLESSGYADKLREAVNNDMQDLFGLSIDVDGHANGKPGKRAATKFLKVNSVDLIMVPGAGGQIISFKEAHNPEGDTMNPVLLRLIEAFRKSNPKLAASITADDDETAIVQLTEAMAKAPQHGTGDGLTLDDVNQAIAQTQRLAEARTNSVALITGSKLPDAAKARLVESVKAATSVSTDETQKLIDAELNYLANFTESGKANMPDGGAAYSNNPNGVELLTALFNPQDTNVVSLKEAYIDITGDKNCTGKISDCSRTRMVEALDSNSLPNVLADVINRRVVEVYAEQEKYQLWRKIFRVVQAGDFKDQNVTEWGGYGDLQTVLESGNYPELAKPTDSNAKYRVSKKGGIATITMEMIKNDDRKVFSQIPGKLANAAGRTLSKFAWDFYLNNRNAPDAKTLFHADHGNLFSAAISKAELLAHWRAIMNQKELGTNELLEIEPAILLCSLGNVDAAYDLFQRGSENDKTFEKNMNLEIIRVPGATDPNDWGLMTDPSELANFEMAFLDGQENPEIFTQDMPNMGTVFTNDQTTLKVRHIYGGQCVDYRGATKAVVI